MELADFNRSAIDFENANDREKIEKAYKTILDILDGTGLSCIDPYVLEFFKDRLKRYSNPITESVEYKDDTISERVEGRSQFIKDRTSNASIVSLKTDRLLYGLSLTEEEYNIINRFIILDSDKKPPSIIIDYNTDKRLPYRSNNQLLKKTTHKNGKIKEYKIYPIHDGQRKLLMTEVYFLSTRIKATSDIKNNMIIYIGASPGNHIEYLATLFPNTMFSLYDPNPELGIYWTDIPLMDTRMDNSRDVKGKLFTDEEAEYWKGFKEEYPDIDLYVITDLRTDNTLGEDGETGDMEYDVMKNMYMQQRWIEIIRPKAAMLKFRLPFDLDNKKFDRDILYLDGEMIVQPWVGPSSTETRLIIDVNNTAPLPKRLYNRKAHEDIMYYYNNIERTFGNYGIQNIMPKYTKKNKIDGCADCYLECFIWKLYIEKYHNSTLQYPFPGIDHEMIERLFTTTTEKLLVVSRNEYKIKQSQKIDNENISEEEKNKKIKNLKQKESKIGKWPHGEHIPIKDRIETIVKSIHNEKPKNIQNNIIQRTDITRYDYKIHDIAALKTRTRSKGYRDPASIRDDIINSIVLTGYDINDIARFINDKKHNLLFYTTNSITIQLDSNVMNNTIIDIVKRARPKLHIDVSYRETLIDDIPQNYLDMALRPFTEQILDNIDRYAVSCIVAGTGSGKTAYLPYILGKINVRVRIAIPIVKAVKFMYKYQKEKSDISIGYAVGGDKHYKDTDNIVYMTAGYLYEKIFSILKTSMKKSDNIDTIKEIKSIVGDVLMIDEVHTGSIHTSALIGILYDLFSKTCKERSDTAIESSTSLDSKESKDGTVSRPADWQGPRLVFASATLNLKDIEPYFNIKDSISKIDVKSNYIVDTIYEEIDIDDIVSGKDYDDTLISIIEREIDLYRSESTTLPDARQEYIGIVFRPGIQEIEKARKILQKTFENTIKICIAYSEMTDEEIEDMRLPVLDRIKVIIGTNILESSVTIENTRFVIDDMLEKIVEAGDFKGTSLTLKTITKSSADQRKGRTGRTCNGRVYRMIKENDYNNIPSYRLRDVDRIPIYDMVLNILDVKRDPLTILNIDTTRYQKILAVLNDNDLLETDKDDKLISTRKGRFVASIPLSLYNACLLYKVMQHNSSDKELIRCTILITSIIEIYSNGLYYIPKENRGDHAFKKRIYKKYQDGCNDDIDVFVKIYNDLKSADDMSKWAVANSINAKTIKNIIKKFKDVVERLELNNEFSTIKTDVKYIEIIKDAFRDTYSDRYRCVGQNARLWKSDNSTTFKIDGSSIFNPKIGKSLDKEIVCCAKTMQITGSKMTTTNISILVRAPKTSIKTVEDVSSGTIRNVEKSKDSKTSKEKKTVKSKKSKDKKKDDKK